MGNTHLITGYAGTEHIMSADQGSFNASFFGTGEYVMEAGNQLAASIISNNKVRILDGDILMQGRHIRIKPNTYEDVTIATGVAGKNRQDLIVCEYSKDANTGIETAEIKVIKGTASSKASDPSITSGNILAGASLNQMPLYRVKINGVVLSSIERLYKKLPSYAALGKQYEQEFIAACTNHLNSLNILDSIDEVEANTQANQLAGALAVKELGENVNALQSAMPSSQGRNLIINPYSDEYVSVINGITWTVKKDGTVVANGTVTGDTKSSFALYAKASEINMTQSGITYTLSGCPSGGGAAKHYMYFVEYSEDTNISFSDNGEGVTFVSTDHVYTGLLFRVYSGQTYNNLTFKPMLEVGEVAHAFEPMSESNVALAAKVSNMSNIISGTLLAGATSITFSDSRISTDSIVEPYQHAGTVDTKIIAPLTVKVVNGSCTMTFDRQDQDVILGIKVY